MKETKITVFEIFQEAADDVKRKHDGEMFPLITLDDLKKTVDKIVSEGDGDVTVSSAYFVKSTDSYQGRQYSTVVGTVTGGFPVKTPDNKQASLFELILDHSNPGKRTTVSKLKEIIDREVQNGHGKCIVCTNDQYNEDGTYWLLEYIETVQRGASVFELYFREVI